VSGFATTVCGGTASQAGPSNVAHSKRMNLAEHGVVTMNISIIMSGIDPHTKKFTEPPELIKQAIAALKADQSVPEDAKKESLAQLEMALKDAKPIQFKENVALVLKYLDKLPPLMEQGPAD